MTFDTVFLFGHVLSAMIWLGGGVALCVQASRVRATRDVAAIADFGATLAYVGPRVLTPAVVGTAAFGIALLLGDGGSEIGEAWVLIGIALFVAALAVGIGYLARIGLRLGRLGGGQTGAESAAGLLSSWIRGYGLVLLILVAVTYDMIAKPSL